MARKLIQTMSLVSPVAVALEVSNKKKLQFTATIDGDDVADASGSIRKFKDVDSVLSGLLENNAALTSVVFSVNTTDVKAQRIPANALDEATRLKTRFTSYKATALSTKTKIDANLLQIAAYNTSGIPAYVARYNEVVATQTAVAAYIVWLDAQIAIQDAIITP